MASAMTAPLRRPTRGKTARMVVGLAEGSTPRMRRLWTIATSMAMLMADAVVTMVRMELMNAFAEMKNLQGASGMATSIGTRRAVAFLTWTWMESSAVQTAVLCRTVLVTWAPRRSRALHRLTMPEPTCLVAAIRAKVTSEGG